ncbi:MAG: hypothetical protein COU70_01255 [Parcubacteria group bacterium CG10_big_fil_rev_8_21_14_0_10_35_15]|nr:MAG: hypothetical protein COU70_01255 [Parcubacteria group bacterium CG10_big_fil_rev_8_21_14_0_10_35_15]
MSITGIQKSYLAGFIDGDGSIYVKLTKNNDYKYGYQVCPYVVLYQSSINEWLLKKIQKIIDMGYIRKRNDGVTECIIGRTDSIKKLMKWIKPYALLKQKQIKLMLDILEAKKKVKNKKDFLELCKLIDYFKALNYSKRRTNTSKKVKIALDKKLITP